MPTPDRLFPLLAMVAWLLYLAPIVVRGVSPTARRMFSYAAATTFGVGMALAVVATIRWFILR